MTEYKLVVAVHGGSGVSNIFPGCGSNLSQAEAAELEVLAGVK